MCSWIGLARAKSLQKGGNGGKKALLWEHIEEALERALQFKKMAKNGVESTPKFLRQDVFYKDLVKALFVHDLGKIERNFQKKLYREMDGNEKELAIIVDKFPSIDEKRVGRVRHEIFSVLWSALLCPGKEGERIRTAVLLHHYNDYFSKFERKFSSLVEGYEGAFLEYLDAVIIKKGEAKKFLEECVEKLLENGKLAGDSVVKEALLEIKSQAGKIEIFEKLREKIENFENDVEEGMEFLNLEDTNIREEFEVFLGLMRRCDYAASAFVSAEYEKEVDSVYQGLEKNIAEAIKSEESKAPKFWQKRVMNRIGEKNVALVAPTGSGKTEFALLWAAKKKKKLVYTLPLRVALNDLYNRFQEKGKYFSKEETGLLHSTAFLEYLEEENDFDLGIGKKEDLARLLVPPILLATPDQVLLASLNYYGSDKVVSAYPFSALVLDEVQAYSPEMMAIVFKTLKIAKRLGCPTLVITATLTPPMEELLKRPELQFEVIDVVNLPEKREIKNYSIRRHRVKAIKENLVEGEGLGECAKREIERFLQNPKKNVLVITNTVNKALKVYEELKKMVENEKEEKVLLLHARVLEKRKKKVIETAQQKIKSIKNGEETSGIVLVATQVVEASVDLDFDVLFTEISPIDSQIQRWGRVYRNKEKDYGLEEPNVYVFLGKETPGEGIYEKNALKNTAKVLESFLENSEKPLNYEEERELIRKSYQLQVEGQGKKTLKELYLDEVKECESFLEVFTAERRSDAQRIFRSIATEYFVFPELIEDENKDLAKAFSEVIKENSEETKSYEPTWKEITKKVAKRIGVSGEKDIEKLTYSLKALLYGNALAVPHFRLKDCRRVLGNRNFKGFFVGNLERLQTRLKRSKKKESKEKIKRKLIIKGIDSMLEEIDFDNDPSLEIESDFKNHAI